MPANSNTSQSNRKQRRARLAYRQAGSPKQFHLSKEQVVMAMVGQGIMSNPRV